MRSFRRIVWWVGIIGGLAFTIHASFPYLESWPMIWPPITGATAFRQPVKTVCHQTDMVTVQADNNAVYPIIQATRERAAAIA
jgi:hypothetical protein